MKKKLVLRALCVIFVPLAALTVYFSVFRMSYMDAEYPLFTAQSDYIGQKNDNRIIILGDSRSKAGVIPSVIGDRVYNLSLGGTTPIEMYYSLKNYLTNSSAPEKIVISFAPQHYYRNDCFWERSVYFHYFSPSELKEALKYARETSSPVYYDGCEKDAVKYFIFSPDKYSAALLNSLKEDRLSKNKRTYSSVAANMGHKLYGRASGSTELNFEATEKQFYTDPLDCIYLEKLLDLCVSANAQTYLLQMPVNESSKKAMSEEYEKGFASYMREINEKYPGIYVMTDIPSYPDEYFGDNSHLNFKGAVLYSESLRDLLELYQ